MKIVSWNVNGLRAVLKNREQSLKSFLDQLDADVVCLQETKASRQGLDRASCVADGYTSFFSFCKVKGGYSGVASFCRNSATPIRAEEGLTGVLATNEGVGFTGECSAHFSSRDDMVGFEREGRAVVTEHTCDTGRGVRSEGGRGEGVRGEGGSLVIVNVYCPMVDRENVKEERLSYKMLFYSVLQDRCSTLEQAGKHVIVAGDLNGSREAIDSAYIQDTPSLLHGCPEREWMKSFVTSHPHTLTPSHSSLLIDTFRHLNPYKRESYTCWSTFLGYRKTNYGTRIDYILCSSSLAPNLTQAEVWGDMTGSDHCPVMAEFSLSLVPSQREPPLSLHLLLGQQTTLSSFLEPQTAHSKGGVKPAPSVKKSSGKGVKRKASEVASSSEKTAKTLKNFFRSPEGPVGGSCSGKTDPMPPSSSSSSSGQLSREWSCLLSGPPKPPLCGRHREPAVLRTVRKAGPTKGRQFWVCDRPAGSRSDSRTQCDFFQWYSTSHSKRKVT